MGIVHVNMNEYQRLIESQKMTESQRMTEMMTESQSLTQTQNETQNLHDSPNVTVLLPTPLQQHLNDQIHHLKFPTVKVNSVEQVDRLERVLIHE
jgi:hypothetical protein